MPITTKVVSSNPFHARCTTLCDKVCQWLSTDRWFSSGYSVLGYLRMILWKISTAISIKHRILATFNIKKNSILTACMPLKFVMSNSYKSVYWFGMCEIVCWKKKSTWHKPKHWRILQENDTKRGIQQALSKNKKNVIPTYSIFHHVCGKHNLVSFYGRVIFWQ
jgi:hypothetical protein